MRTGKLTILGREYPLCFSTQVVCDVSDKFGGLNQLMDALRSEDLTMQLRTAMWTLAEMSRAGHAYAALCGEETPKPLTEEQLLAVFGPDDLAGLYGKIMQTITDGSRREVEAEPPKNAATTGVSG